MSDEKKIVYLRKLEKANPNYRPGVDLYLILPKLPLSNAYGDNIPDNIEFNGQTILKRSLNQVIMEFRLGMSWVVSLNEE